MLVLRTSPRWMLALVLALAAGGFAGCSIVGPCQDASCQGVLPTNLPADPEPCTKYCRVWKPPVYRDVPCVVQTQCGYSRCVPTTVMKTCYRETCVKPKEAYRICEPDHCCEQAVVQVTPGGYKWKDAGCGCYRYCYEAPCYQWCNKVVHEEGIEYCTETSPEYRVQVSHVPIRTTRQEYVPAEFGVCWKKEVYEPGRWEWQPIKECVTCDCPREPCPTIPYQPRPCWGGLCQGCPRTN